MDFTPETLRTRSRRALLTLVAALFAALCVLAVPDVAAAGEPDAQYETLKSRGGQALLEAADKRHNPFVDQTMTVRMTLEGGGNDGKSLQITTITKGATRAVRFEEPADMKGMGVVIKGRDEIYVRLPGAEKVRRVGSHAKRQSFEGTDWNFDEMALIRFADDYEATIAEENDTHVILDLKRRADSETLYPKLVVTLDKSVIMIDSIEYIDDEGQTVKRQTRSGLETNGDHKIYKINEMSTLSAGTTTRSEVVEELVDTNVDDSTFSRRWLVRGL